MYKRLTIDISGVCNAKCKWCTTGINNRKHCGQGGFISAALFERGVDYLLERRFIGAGTDVWLFSWGEPFLNRELCDIIGILVGRGLCYTLSTNASQPVLLPPQYLGNLNLLMFSLSGFSEESYRRIHGLDFGRIQQNIATMSRHLAENGHPYKGSMNFHVYQYNIGEIEAASEFCERERIRFNPYCAYLADFEQYSRYLEGTLEPGILGQAARELFLCQNDRAVPQGFICPQKEMLTLDERLQVLPCCCLTSSHSVGSLFDYAGPGELAARLNNLPICRRCQSNGYHYLVHSDHGFPYGFRSSGSQTQVLDAPRIYLDTGSGYSEAQTIQLQSAFYRGRLSLGLRLALPPQTRALRFDPVEGRGCLVEDFKVWVGGSCLPSKNLNGERRGGLDLFAGTDPQIEVGLNPPGATEAYLCAQISVEEGRLQELLGQRDNLQMVWVFSRSTIYGSFYFKCMFYLQSCSKICCYYQLLGAFIKSYLW